MAAINRVIVSGTISDWGVKLSYTEQSKPQLSFSLVVSEAGREEATFRTFVPVLIMGPQAEPLAETLDAHDYVLIEGKLMFKSGKTKDSGKLVVLGSGVEVLQQHTETASESSPGGV
jgi:hypothetical protein